MCINSISKKGSCSRHHNNSHCTNFSKAPSFSPLTVERYLDGSGPQLVSLELSQKTQVAILRRRLNAIAWWRGRGVERSERRRRSYTTVEVSSALAGCRIELIASPLTPLSSSSGSLSFSFSSHELTCGKFGSGGGTRQSAQTALVVTTLSTN